MDILMTVLCIAYLSAVVSTLVTATVACLCDAWKASTRGFLASLGVAILVTPFIMVNDAMVVLLVTATVAAIAFGFKSFIEPWLVPGVKSATSNISSTLGSIGASRAGLSLHLSK